MRRSLSHRAMKVNPSATLAIDAKFKSMQAAGENVVGFGAGEPDFDTPEYIKEAAIAAIRAGKTKYTPASGLLELKEAICRKLESDSDLKYDASQIVVSSGAKHSLYNALRALCNPGDEVILPAPFWVSYEELIKMVDAIPVILQTREEDNFAFTGEQLEALITDKTKAVIINSPSNPTGMVINDDKFAQIARICEKHSIYVISDEIYERLIYDGLKHHSIASMGDEIKDLTIVVRGVSKTCAMTGWRIGYTASNSEIARIMSNYQSHSTSNACTISQYASIEALSNGEAQIDAMCTAFRERRDYMVQRINQMDGVHCLNPEGAFYVMMNIGDLIDNGMNGVNINDADQFCEMLLEKAGVAMVPGTSFRAPRYVRLSYAASMQNIEEGLNRLEKFLSGK